MAARPGHSAESCRTDRGRATSRAGLCPTRRDEALGGVLIAMSSGIDRSATLPVSIFCWVASCNTRQRRLTVEFGFCRWLRHPMLCRNDDVRCTSERR